MMAAARRTTRQQQGGKNTVGDKGKPEESKTEEQVEVVDLCSENGDADNTTAEAPQSGNGASVKEEDEASQMCEEFGFRTFFDFESEDSIPNATVKSFLQDCLKQPKILCHKRFRPFRDFISEAMGFVFELPQDAPYLLDHEDNKFCVDKGDKWLVDLKRRVKRSYQAQQNISDDSDDDEEDTLPPYYWATITPVQRKSDLGLIIFAWTPLPMTIPILDVYLTWVKARFVPPTPPKPPSPPPPQSLRSSRKKSAITPRRTTRAFLKQKVALPEPVREEEKAGEEKETHLIVPNTLKEDSTKPEEGQHNGNNDNSIDDYIKEFTHLFNIARGIDAEERLKGDDEAKERRKLENKEEPKYSRELVELIRRNRHINTPVTLVSRKPQGVNGYHQQDSDSSDSQSETSSNTSAESACSEYTGRYFVKGNRKSYKTRKPVETRQVITTPQRSRPVNSVANGVGRRILNGTIKSSNTGSRIPSPTISTKSAGKTKSTSKIVTCDACRPPKVFQSRKALYKHLSAKHAPRNRILTLCKCGIKIRKERLEFHKRYCKKAITDRSNKIVKQMDKS